MIPIFDAHLHWKKTDFQTDEYKNYLDKVDSGIAVVEPDELNDYSSSALSGKLSPAIYLLSRFTEDCSTKESDLYRTTMDAIKDNDITILKIYDGYPDYFNSIRHIKDVLKKGDFTIQIHTHHSIGNALDRMPYYKEITENGGKLHLVHGYGQIRQLLGMEEGTEWLSSKTKDLYENNPHIFKDKRFDIENFNERTRTAISEFRELLDDKKIVLGSTRYNGYQTPIREYGLGDHEDDTTDVEIFEKLFGPPQNCVVFESDLNPVRGDYVIEEILKNQRYNRIFFKNGYDFYKQ
ncbi:MAG: hypothetical protein V1718_01960 [archaeon]